MAEYFNQTLVNMAEVTTLMFNHQVNGEVENSVQLTCHNEHIPHLIATLQQTYDAYQSMMANAQKALNTNKNLS